MAQQHEHENSIFLGEDVSRVLCGVQPLRVQHHCQRRRRMPAGSRRQHHSHHTFSRACQSRAGHRTRVFRAEMRRRACQYHREPGSFPARILACGSADQAPFAGITGEPRHGSTALFDGRHLCDTRGTRCSYPQKHCSCRVSGGGDAGWHEETANTRGANHHLQKRDVVCVRDGALCWSAACFHVHVCFGFFIYMATTSLYIVFLCEPIMCMRHTGTLQRKHRI